MCSHGVLRLPVIARRVIFGYVCMFSVTKDEITTETAYVLTLLLLLPNPLVEHKRPTDVPL